MSAYNTYPNPSGPPEAPGWGAPAPVQPAHGNMYPAWGGQPPAPGYGGGGWDTSPAYGQGSAAQGWENPAPTTYNTSPSYASGNTAPSSGWGAPAPARNTYPAWGGQVQPTPGYSGGGWNASPTYGQGNTAPTQPAYGSTPPSWESLAPTTPGYGNTQPVSMEQTGRRVEEVTGRELVTYFGSLGGFALKGVGATLRAAVRPGRGFVDNALNNGWSSAVTDHKLAALQTGVNAFEHAHNTDPRAAAIAAKMDAMLDQHFAELSQARRGY